MEEASRTTSGLIKLMNASKSRRSNVRNAAIRSSTGSGCPGCSDISLRPCLGEAFGGNTSLADVGARHDAHAHARFPNERKGQRFMHSARAPGRAAMKADHRKHHPIAEVPALQNLLLVLLESADPIFKEAADRRRSLVGAKRRLRCIPDCIGGVDAHRSVEVTATVRLVGLPRKLHQVGGRGLLGHLPASIPLTTSRWNTRRTWRCCQRARRPRPSAFGIVWARLRAGSAVGMRRQVVLKGTLRTGRIRGGMRKVTLHGQ